MVTKYAMPFSTSGEDEKLTGINDPDIIWIFDMMEEVGSFPHNLANSSPVAYQNLPEALLPADLQGMP